jgi:hypothetical protein
MYLGPYRWKSLVRVDDPSSYCNRYYFLFKQMQSDIALLSLEPIYSMNATHDLNNESSIEGGREIALWLFLTS